MSALETGVSGMLANQARMDAVGNNIANANTNGYKSSRVLFADALYQVVDPASGPSANLGGTNPGSLGQGVLVSGMQTDFSQGSLSSTGRSTDIAIEGEGFLAVTDGTKIYYTRNGALGLDANGYLIHLATGKRVVALNASGGSPVSPTATLQIPLGQSSASQATTQMSVGGNLDAGAAQGTSFPVTAQVYDSLGAAHPVTLTFTRSATGGQWDVSGTSADGTITVGPPAQVSFDTNGAPTVNSLPLQMTLTNANGAAATLKMDLSLKNVTQMAQGSSVALRSQDGLPPGILTGISIDSDGSIVGIHSNSLRTKLGQIPTAIFSNTGGLQSIGGSLYQASLNSGTPAFGNPGDGGRGALRSGELESSNVNLAQEFADMIVTQRGFQASSRVITTADQMIQELMTLTR